LPLLQQRRGAFAKLGKSTSSIRSGCRKRAGLSGEGRSSVWRGRYLFTSESVSEGHPDKVCDQISDAILDALIQNDLKLGIAEDSKVNTRLGCETLCTTNKIIVANRRCFRNMASTRWSIER
jgi:hypothetical protein